LPFITVEDALAFMQVFLVDILNATPSTAAAVVGFLTPLVYVLMIAGELLVKGLRAS
jgi:hypothetical protein